MGRRLPKSARKFLRFQKAEIRRKFLDLDRQKEETTKLYERFEQTSGRSIIKKETKNKKVETQKS